MRVTELQKRVILNKILIDYLVDKGRVPTMEQLAEEMEKAFSKIVIGAPFFPNTKIYSKEITSAERYNSRFRDLELDLKILYNSSVSLINNMLSEYIINDIGLKGLSGRAKGLLYRAQELLLLLDPASGYFDSVYDYFIDSSKTDYSVPTTYPRANLDLDGTRISLKTDSSSSDKFDLTDASIEIELNSAYEKRSELSSVNNLDSVLNDFDNVTYGELVYKTDPSPLSYRIKIDLPNPLTVNTLSLSFAQVGISSGKGHIKANVRYVDFSGDEHNLPTKDVSTFVEWNFGNETVKRIYVFFDVSYSVVEGNLFEYKFILNNISLYNNTYHTVCDHYSTVLSLENNEIIDQMSLEVDEIVPDGTDIQYFIKPFMVKDLNPQGYIDNENSLAWVPIKPISREGSKSLVLGTVQVRKSIEDLQVGRWFYDDDSDTGLVRIAEGSVFNYIDGTLVSNIRPVAKSVKLATGIGLGEVKRFTSMPIDDDLLVNERDFFSYVPDTPTISDFLPSSIKGNENVENSFKNYFVTCSEFATGIDLNPFYKYYFKWHFYFTDEPDASQRIGIRFDDIPKDLVYDFYSNGLLMTLNSDAIGTKFFYPNFQKGNNVIELFLDTGISGTATEIKNFVDRSLGEEQVAEDKDDVNVSDHAIVVDRDIRYVTGVYLKDDPNFTGVNYYNRVWVGRNIGINLDAYTPPTDPPPANPDLVDLVAVYNAIGTIAKPRLYVGFYDESINLQSFAQVNDTFKDNYVSAGNGDDKFYRSQVPIYVLKSKSKSVETGDPLQFFGLLQSGNSYDVFINHKYYELDETVSPPAMSEIPIDNDGMSANEKEGLRSILRYQVYNEEDEVIGLRFRALLKGKRDISPELHRYKIRCARHG